MSAHPPKGTFGSTSRKLAAAGAAVVLLLGAACTRGGDDDDETTPAPTQPERVDVADDFQLVGRIEEAFTGAEPAIEVPDRESAAIDDEDAALEDEDAAGPTLAPQDEPFGSTPSVGGVMRITIEDASNALSAECGVAAEEAVDVFWTTDTSFDPEDVLEDVDARNEDGIEGRIAGVSGRILLTSDDRGEITSEPEPTVSVDDAELEATGSPDDFFDSEEDLRSDAEGSECVLVADQVGFESSALPTPSTTSGTRRPTVATTPEPDDTPEPTEKPRSTKEPRETDEPDETDEPATSTAGDDTL